MDRIKTIEILEALASGCSPITGETINESIINERVVIRALQSAIDLINSNTTNIITEIEISEKDIKSAIQLYKQQNQNPTSHKLTGLFLGTRKFKNNFLITNQLYGKYRDQYTEGQLLDFFTEYFAENKVPRNSKDDLYSEIDFFRKEKFNRLSENAIKQLKEKVNELGIEKTENLTEYILNARIIHPRAYESWSDKEKTLLSKALEYTNDLDLLSSCFQRGKGSIETCGQKIIYESQK
ncbi:hypothetical protein [Paludibacter propionicigenes]|uniref:hypothetical protein n=1 Tax=Paludibacter propionicigenes TaxID=185300 RepID=UPI00031D83A0|nr:hypothetical protein [Paludibacter propionicigenes]